VRFDPVKAWVEGTIPCAECGRAIDKAHAVLVDHPRHAGSGSGFGVRLWVCADEAACRGRRDRRRIRLAATAALSKGWILSKVVIG
jgi:hypothetical protein